MLIRGHLAPLSITVLRKQGQVTQHSELRSLLMMDINRRSDSGMKLIQKDTEALYYASETIKTIQYRRGVFVYQDIMTKEHIDTIL